MCLSFKIVDEFMKLEPAQRRVGNGGKSSTGAVVVLSPDELKLNYNQFCPLRDFSENLAWYTPLFA